MLEEQTIVTCEEYQINDLIHISKNHTNSWNLYRKI